MPTAYQLRDFGQPLEHTHNPMRTLCSVILLIAITLCSQLTSVAEDMDIRHLHELHQQERATVREIQKSQEKAYQECLAQIDGLLSLKTSSANHDGSLLSDAEYAARRGKLMKEKATMEFQLNGGESQVDQPLHQSAQAFEFADAVRERFITGDTEAKKLILQTMSSNLTLKDKILSIEAKKPFFILGSTLSIGGPSKLPIEPEKTLIPQGQKALPQILCPSRRKMRDLNPRRPLSLTTFPRWRTRPLCESSNLNYF